MDEDVDWSKSYTLNQLKTPNIQPRKPVVDKEVSKVLDRPVMTNDPRLIRAVAEYKRKKHSTVDSERPDNFMKDQEFIKDLKKKFDG